MSGKSYTLREMKLIVDYLVEHRLYNDTRGRKMWVDYANTKLTRRTWQSLKETFLKRILPDITNPYYKLEPDQILSFKRGLDLTQKDKKLILVPVNTPVNDTNGDNVQPSTSKNNSAENATGEDTNCSKIVHDRASTETLILDTCYQTAEDIQRDLESSGGEHDAETLKDGKKPVLKSVRDFIEYSEPLTPMLQEVLDDFATDEDCSDTEPPMQIDESYVDKDVIVVAPDNPASSQSILQPNTKDNQAKQVEIIESDVEKPRNEIQVTGNNEESVKPTNETTFSQLEDVMVLVDEALAKDLDKELDTQKAESPDNQTNSSIPMTDTLLPNNQEAVITAPNDESRILDGSNCNTQHGNKKNGDTNIKNTHLILDEQEDNLGSVAPIASDSNTEKTKDIVSPQETNKSLDFIQHVTQNKSPSEPTTNDDKIHEIHSDSSGSNENVRSKVDNPCLKSVSLFSEHLDMAQCSDGDSNKSKENSNEQSKPKVATGPKDIEAKNNEENNYEARKSEVLKDEGANSRVKPADVILFHSHTTSGSNDDSLTNHKPLARSSLKKQKDKKLASVFGFSNGAGSKSRRRRSRKKSSSHRNLPSDSSDWTSASDSDYVSPPLGRRNRYARKYLKPRSARIMSLDEEGGLFVMLGKKVYPLVKDGKAVKNYVSYLPESDPEEEDSYWKSKYIEEKKRSAELQKKLGLTNGVICKESKDRSISLSSPISENPPKLTPGAQRNISGKELMPSTSAVNSSHQETLKIKFTKNDQEVQLEGHWQYINPVLAQVVAMLHKEPVKTKNSETVTCMELSSGMTTPVVTPDVTPTDPLDKGVHEKVNEMESEIFKEIEEQDNAEVVEEKENQETNGDGKENDVPVENGIAVAGEQTSNTPVEDAVQEQSKVTQRKKRGRPKKESSLAPPVTQSPAKKQKKSAQKNKASDVESVKSQTIEDSTPSATRQTRTPRKLLDGIVSKPKIGLRKSKAKIPIEVPIDVPETEIEQADDEVRYKFPSPETRTSKATNINKISKDSPKEHLPNIVSPDSLSRHSINSSQGYQDSDTSPFNIGKRRKRRLSASTLSLNRRKTQRKHRSNSYPLIKRVNYALSDSSFSISVESRREQSNSDIYKSDSYQFLMPRTRTIMQRLERIDEANSNENAVVNSIRILGDEMQASDPTNKSDAASSSNLSLPLSPELSIVENLSISKSAMSAIDEPSINQSLNNVAMRTCNNEYRISAVDVSMPLMAQNCALQEMYKKQLMSAMSILSDMPNSAGRNLSNDSSMKISLTSESILKNEATFNVESSDSLDRRLEQLLLESAQKTVQKRGDTINIDTQTKKKSGSRKRCSTPHKKTVQNKKKRSEELIVEKESKVQCSRGGRRSCPPSINIVYYEDNAPDNLEINIQDESIDAASVTKGKRVKKDIIKVKIVRPKDKAQKKKRKSKNGMPDGSQTSGNTVGDNESGVFLQGFEDSGELIHNHSETCLQIRDCMSDSVEFIETTTKSIISLSSGSFNMENTDNLIGNSMESRKTTPEMFCDNAQCATYLHDARETEARSADSGNTVYFTPAMSPGNSVLTDDLSDEAPVKQNAKTRPSKWYLLSDEESNTNYFDVQDSNPSYGANLQQLFPITCAIPDLSTITEMSERNENSRKES